LELLLPSSFDEEERSTQIGTILPYVKSPTLTRIRAGNDVGVDEAEFWETPSPSSGEEGFE
jgi:hypothetical protein